MKRVISVLSVIMLLMTLVCPVFVQASDFTDSVPNKDAPDIVPVKNPEGGDSQGTIKDDNGIIEYLEENCIVITPVSEANTSELIPEEARKTLLDVYKQLSDGTMELPVQMIDPGLVPEDIVIRDLFDASWLCSDHPVKVTPEGIYVEITFNMGVDEEEEIYCMLYENGEWEPAVNVTNNGDGTVTVLLEHLGVIAFGVEQDGPPTQSGDNSGPQVIMWVILMVVSAAALVALLVINRRRNVQ